MSGQMSGPAKVLHPRHWSLGFKGGVIIAASLLLLLGSAATSYTLERKTEAATKDMLLSMRAHADIERLHSQVAEAATGVRGYLLTGRDDFLTPYREATLLLPSTLAGLQARSTDPEQRASLRRIAPLLQQKLASLETMRGQRNASAVELQQHLLSSKRILDKLRAEIGIMSQRESTLVKERSQALQKASNRNLWMTIAVAAAGLAGAMATLAFTVGLVRRVRLAAENAERLNSDLPLKPTPDTRDELGQLADRLHQASVLLAGRASAALSASQAKTQFLARTSHELRTPLNAILGYAQLLEAGLKAPREREHAEHIRKAGQHLLSLIDEVLDIGRIEAGKLTLGCAPVALAPLVDEAVMLMAPMALQRGVSLRHGSAAGAGAVMADRQRLLQVMLNLLSNAIKYGKQGGNVDIGFGRDAASGTVSIHIDDAGAGITPALRTRLFAPFDRLGAERGKIEGAGLGLAVSKALMQAMQGDINLDKKAGQGSRFTLTLPGADAVAGARAGATADANDNGYADTDTDTDAGESTGARVIAAPAPLATTHSMICIDADAGTRALITTLMQRRPAWRITAAADKAGGIALARQAPPDLLLVACDLADDAVRALPGELVVLGGAAVEGVSGVSDVSGAPRHLAKPLKIPEFFALLDTTEQKP
jgi:signal transduction histidine kinase